MTMRIIDFAYTEGDERRKGIHPPHISDEDENQDEQEDKEDDQKKDYYHTINTLLSSTQIDLNTFIDISIFQEMHSTHLQNILLPTLANLLHSTPSLDDGLKLAFYPARVSQDIVKVGEWEMTAKKDDYLLIAYRDYANECQSTSYTHQQSECIANEVTLITNLPVETLVDRLLDQTEQTSCNESSLNLGIAPLSDTTKTSSINQTQSTTAPTTTTTTTTNITSNTTSTITNTSTASNTSTRTTASYSPTPILLPLQIDPENDMFATHLREFVEYQKVYGEGWVTGFKVSCKIHKDYDTGVWSTCKMKMRLTEIGLIPKAMIHTLKK